MRDFRCARISICPSQGHDRSQTFIPVELWKRHLEATATRPIPRARERSSLGGRFGAAAATYSLKHAGAHASGCAGSASLQHLCWCSGSPVSAMYWRLSVCGSCEASVETLIGAPPWEEIGTSRLLACEKGVSRCEKMIESSPWTCMSTIGVGFVAEASCRVVARDFHYCT